MSARADQDQGVVAVWQLQSGGLQDEGVKKSLAYKAVGGPCDTIAHNELPALGT